MKRTRNAKKGLTMIELVVAFALSAIFFTALLTVVAPIYRTYQSTSDFADAELIAGNVIDAIRTTANGANTLTAADGVVTVGTRLSYGVSPAGHLQYTVADSGETQTRDVFDAKVYNGKTIELSARQLAENVVDVTVTVRTQHGGATTVSGVISTMHRYVSSGSTGPVIPPDPPTPPDDPDDPPAPPSVIGTGGEKQLNKYLQSLGYAVSKWDNKAGTVAPGIYWHNQYNYVAVYKPLQKEKNETTEAFVARVNRENNAPPRVASIVTPDNVISATSELQKLDRDLPDGTIYVYTGSGGTHSYLIIQTIAQGSDANPASQAFAAKYVQLT